ncbi:hypothetical protein N0O92_08650 [Alkalihalobacillus sp. MEB130]|uniref:hypothetical protein n=1 Tax=Alkalihalobacillus sp. MEB130 TaxID=2976704 RepID=UPI0028E053DA|nr:hypothetical protein [Alkalihalobacillus sp. MEB130]MDT8860301.1 hypothetical protein [Alkalihalobacillus sp. MEB130]
MVISLESEKMMKVMKELDTLTQQRLVEILENAYRRGMEETDAKQLVEEIAASLKPYVSKENK